MTAEIEDRVAALRADVVEMIRRATGQDEATAFRMARQVVDAMLNQFAGAEIYIPKVAAYDRTAVVADIKARLPVRQVCKRHGIGKRTYYRLQRETWRQTI